MRYFVVSALLIFCSFANISAQHCPFDGGHLVAVHLTDANDNPIEPSSAGLTLAEIDNPTADLCTYKEGLLNKPFLAHKQTMQDHYKTVWEYWIEREYSDWVMFNPGYSSVVLGQAENTCMIKNGNNSFDYKQRKYEIRYNDGIAAKTLTVAEEQIHVLCTSAGSWKRIEPIKIQLSTVK